ncbi:hypothetical protein ACVWYS_003804 [Arthrobacter sp. TE12231]
MAQQLGRGLVFDLAVLAVDLRSEACITAVPMPPGEAPMIPVGLREKELVPEGRDPQSMAFLSAPGMDRLYSGETNRMPSDAAIAMACLLPDAPLVAGGWWLVDGKRTWGSDRRSRLTPRA